MVHLAVAEIAIGLGSNVGDRLLNLQEAAACLASAWKVTHVSSVYETSPMYEENQGAFFNAAIRAHIRCGPIEVLRQLKSFEASVGRQHRQRFGPREIDLDLLIYGSLQLFSNPFSLQVPHARTPERLFVLVPLVEIWPNLHLPGLGAARELLEAAKSRRESVVRVEHATLSLHSQHTRR